MRFCVRLATGFIMTTLQQAHDFRAECDALADVLEPLEEGDFEAQTLFKRWTLHDVVAHLHIFNWAADVSIHQPDTLRSFSDDLARGRSRGLSLREVTDEWLEGQRNRAVYERWRDYYPGMCDRLRGVDPKTRVEWFGPSMSIRSSITARQMETWAHGQEVFDSLGLDRCEGDRIKNIVVLGVNTFGWTYAVRKLDVPEIVPHVRLTAPSGEVWEWNEPQQASSIEGKAVEFCQVVTQVRNIADTELTVKGNVAIEWMSMAQCFAGGPETPPAPGTRHRAG
jgi:uncharacterized protein (TIGR03084 family)